MNRPCLPQKVSCLQLVYVYECMKDQIANKSLCKLIYQEELIFNN